MDPLSKPGLPPWPGRERRAAAPVQRRRAPGGCRRAKRMVQQLEVWIEQGRVTHAAWGPLRALSALEMAALLPPKAECRFEDGQRAENRTLDLSAIDVWARLAEVSRAGGKLADRHSGHRGGAAADRAPAADHRARHRARTGADRWRAQRGAAGKRAAAACGRARAGEPGGSGRRQLWAGRGCGLHLSHCPHPCWCVSHRRHRHRLHLRRQLFQRRSPLFQRRSPTTLRARARPNVRGGFR